MAVDQQYADALAELRQAKARIAELEGREQALAAHVARIISEWNSGDDQFSDEWIDRMGDVVEDAPETSLARRDAIMQVEAMRHVANWLSGAIEEGCIGLDLGGEISGPTGCSDADRCRVAGERIFREAARIWECKFVTEAQQ